MGTIGASAAVNASAVAIRMAMPADGRPAANASTRSRPMARSSPTTGIVASAHRVGTTAFSSGRSVRCPHTDGSSVITPLTFTFGPSENAASTRPATRSAMTYARRQHATTISPTRTSSGQPKKAFSSEGFCASRLAVSGSPASDCRAKAG